MRRQVTRREFLAGAAALAATPALGALPASGEVEIAIVGAGAAGISAARRIAAAGRTYALLEAADRIGGRVKSGPGKFGVIHDQGAHRLYGGGRNPLVALGRAERLRLFDPPAGRRLYVGGREARDNEYDDFTVALRRASRAIVATGEAGRDVAAARVMPDLANWQQSISFVLGPLTCTKDLEDVSTVDFARADDRGEEVACRDGLGVVLAAAAKPLKIELDTPVRNIDTGGRAIVLETARGNLRARAVIVTVSTNVLAARRIEFRQGLPKRISDAIERLSLGTYDRIVFELAGNPFGFRTDERVVFWAGNERTAALVGRAGGSDLAYADIAGRFGRELAAAGEPAMLAFLSELMAAQFGSEALGKIGRTEVIRWSADPLILGGFSAAAPGAASSRRVLIEPVDRLFFAGEAAHETQWGTVGGAWASGERAANAALRALTATPATARESAAKKKKKKRK
jgi:monoamine oxidase